MAATHAPSPRGFFDTAMNGFNRLPTVRAGGTEDPMGLYVKFRGAEPKIDALLERRGLTGGAE